VTVALVVLVAASAWLAAPPGVHRPTAPALTSPAPVADAAPDRLRRWGWPLAAGLGGWGFVSGLPGLLVGAVVAVVVWLVLRRAESPAERRRRERLRADLPHVVGLLAAGVRSGLSPAEAIAVVGAALPGPAADALAPLPPRVALGVDPVEAWRILEADAHLAPLGRTLARSARTGEPIAEALDRLGHELSARGRAEVEDAARRVGVRAAIPLGLCLLPSFLLLGIVPVVAGLVSALGG
jgi:Flp pilus assembly protein TadB